MMQVLDAVSALDKLNLTAELAGKVKLLSGTAGLLERVDATKRVTAILRELGVGIQTASAATQAAESGFPLKEASSSYSGISHSGNSRAKSDEADYEKTISEAVEEARPLAETDAQRAALSSEEATFRSEYLSQYKSLMGVRSGTYSGHIAGRSGLNSKQANSRNSALDKAMDRFYGWVKAQDGRIKAAVLAARNPEQLAAAKAIKDAGQAEKDAKAAALEQKNIDLMVKLLSFKSGDKLTVGSAVITKVSKTRDGVPSTLTVMRADGSQPFDDKLDVLRALYRNDKARLASDYAAAMAMLAPAKEGHASEVGYQRSLAADEYAAQASGFPSFTDYASAREETPGAELIFTIARAKYKIVERLEAVGRDDKLFLESLALHGANGRGIDALSELRNSHVVERNLRAKSGQYQLASGVTLASFVAGLAIADQLIEPDFDAPQSEWDEYEKRRDKKHGEEDLSPTLAGFKSIEEQKAERLKERLAEQEKAESQIPAGVMRAMRRKVDDEISVAAGRYVDGGYPNEQSATDGRDLVNFMRAASAKDKYTLKNAEARYRKTLADAPQVEPSPDAGTETAADQPTYEVVEHVTGRGKTIRGVIRKDLSYAEAKAIDEYTFKKDGGYFIREKHLEGFAPQPAGERPEPVVKPELTPEQAAQAEADRLANEQLREAEKRQTVAGKLRAAGEATIEKADEELGRDRQTNTARRAHMASNINERNEASRAIGKTMQNLADAIESGEAQHLSGVTSRATVETLHGLLVSAMYEHDRSQNLSYGEQQRQKGRPATEQDAKHAVMPQTGWNSAGASAAKILEAIKGKRGAPALANKIRYSAGPDAEMLRELKAMLGPKDFEYQVGWYNVAQSAKIERLRRAGITNNEELRAALTEYLQYREGARAEDPIKKAERAIIGQKVGIDFFPTPAATASRMADLARISKGDRVLEPSAGNGNLADAARAKGAEVDVLEISSQLRDILKAKGYNVVDHDFESFSPAEKYDAVIMNPPFSARKDAEHIQRAYNMLKPGGRLVAIAGEGVFIGSDSKAVQFRDWLDAKGADVESLDKNTFKDKNLLATTGANGRLIVLTK